jgi:hypothetical protein
MDLLTADDLTRLAEGRGGTRVSLFLPTHRGGPQTVRNRIRLKNLLRHAENGLRDEGLPGGRLDAILEPARQLLDFGWLWDQPSDGLALFCGADDFRHLRVPLRLPELVTIGDRFVVRPLLPLLAAGGHFYVLTLTQDEIRLLEGTRSRLEEVPLHGLPLAVWQTMPRRQSQVHAFVADRGGTGGRAVFHGSGDEDLKGRVRQHFHRVDQNLRDVIRDRRAPLLLAGVGWLQALYRKANTHPELLPTGVDGNPRDISLQRLHRRAWALAEPVLRANETAAAARYHALQGTGRTSGHLAEVIAAAERARIDTLFLSTDTPGRLIRAAAGPLIRLDTAPDLGEQLDRAAAATLRHNGQVHAVAAARMPEAGPVAAILRF